MSTIEDPRHPSYVKYALADILIIIMCGVLCGLDTLGDLVVYAKSKADFLRETFGIEKIPSKATFGRILSMVDGKQIGDVILDVLRERFGTMGEVIAVDGKAICSTARGENSHKALQILNLCDRQRHHIGAGSRPRKDKRDSRFSRNAHILGCREQSCYSGRHTLPAGDIPLDRAEEGGLSVRLEGKSTVLARDVRLFFVSAE